MVNPGRRVLVLSFYFTPDLSAGSFRCAALVEALLAADPSLRVDVITTQPNRYRSFSSDALDVEVQGRLTVTRVRLPPHASGMRDQARAFLTYARAVARLATATDYALVLGTSSRLMTAVLSARTATRLRAPLYLDIRDIFVDTIGDVVPRPIRPLTRVAFGPLERWAIGRASRVNLVSEGFRDYFVARFPRQVFSYHTNGVDDMFERAGVARASRDPATPLRIVYAGNIGEGQGLHAIVPGMAKALRGRATFRIIGDGGRRPHLETELLAHAVEDLVTIMPPVPRDALLDEYLGADVLFLHLNDHAAFEKVLPSKIFEYAALGKPILAGVGGYAAHFLRTEVSNAGVFAPCDVSAGVAALGALELVDRPRTTFLARFRRSAIMQRLAAEVLATARSADHGGAI